MQELAGAPSGVPRDHHRKGAELDMLECVEANGEPRKQAVVFPDVSRQLPVETSISASASQDDEALARGFSTLGEETISNEFGRLLSAHPPYSGSALPEHLFRCLPIQRRPPARG